MQMSPTKQPFFLLELRLFETFKTYMILSEHTLLYNFTNTTEMHYIILFKCIIISTLNFSTEKQ